MNEMAKRIASVLMDTAMFEGRNPALADLVAIDVLNAMREPTEDMIASCPHEDAWHVWRDMMNVALGEPVT